MLIWHIMSSAATRRVSVKNRRSPQKANSKRPAFDVKSFLNSAGPGRKIETFRSKETVFAQGDPAKNVMYIQDGSLKLAVVNEAGKEAVTSIRGAGEFLREGCLAGHNVRMKTATAIAPTTVLVIGKNEMIRLRHEEHGLSDRFIAFTLAVSLRAEGDLIDQLFNSTEKRLARALLLLARYGAPGHPQEVLHKVSQEMLAEMIGTTRSRVNVFMNKFRKLGLVQYSSSKIHINDSLLSVVLHD